MTDHDQQTGDTRTLNLGPVEKVIVGIIVALLTSGLISAISLGWSITTQLARIDGSIGVLGLRVDGHTATIADHEQRLRDLERRGN